MKEREPPRDEIPETKLTSVALSPGWDARICAAAWRRRSAEKSDELAPLHVTTQPRLAASAGGGTVKP
jgi:hypothetical protein